MAKKKDLPYMPFYIGDWFKAPDVRALPLDARMIWFEMLCLMWESKRRGYLEINGKSVSDSVISKMLGCVITEFEQALKLLEDFGLFSRDENGTIFCRRMVRDEEKRQKKQKAGKIGMEKRYSVNTSVITESITNADICNMKYDIKEEDCKGETKLEPLEERKSKCGGPSFSDVSNFFKENNRPEDEAVIFWNEYEQKKWYVSNREGEPTRKLKTTRDWMLKAEQWIKKARMSESNGFSKIQHNNKPKTLEEILQQRI